MGDDVPPGTTAPFKPPVDNEQLDVSARLEADATTTTTATTQDQCPGTASPQNSCLAPPVASTSGQRAAALKKCKKKRSKKARKKCRKKANKLPSREQDRFSA